MTYLTLSCKELPNGWRYRQGRDLADKTTRRRIRRWDRIPESVGSARTCPVHAVLGAFLFYTVQGF